MPRDKDLKRIIRKRMEKTGESYTAARARVLEKPAKRTLTKTPRKSAAAATRAASATESAPARSGAKATKQVAERMTTPSRRTARKSADATTARTPTPRRTTTKRATATKSSSDLASVAGMSDEKMVEKTGRNWADWVTTLDAEGAAEMIHRDIAKIVYGKYQVDGWWAQAVTVGYERIKGLRERGQRRTGTYEAAKSRTFHVPVDVLFDAWADAKTRKRWLKDANPKVRTATKPRSMRLGWEDGSIIALWFDAKGPSKSVVAVQHTRLPDRAAAESFKTYWSERLADLALLLKP